MTEREREKPGAGSGSPPPCNWKSVPYCPEGFGYNHTSHTEPQKSGYIPMRCRSTGPSGLSDDSLAMYIQTR